MFLGLVDPDPYQAKIVRNTLIPTVLLLLYDFLSLKNNVNTFKINKQKNFGKNSFFVGVSKVNNENDRTRIRIHKSEVQIRTEMSRIRNTSYRSLKTKVMG
jgi:hypothetical protein